MDYSSACTDVPKRDVFPQLHPPLPVVGKVAPNEFLLPTPLSSVMKAVCPGGEKWEPFTHECPWVGKTRVYHSPGDRKRRWRELSVPGALCHLSGLPSVS